MSFDLLSKLQEYRQEISQKAKNKTQINDTLKRVSMKQIKQSMFKKNKSEFNLEGLKKDFMSNTKRLQMKSTIQNIQISPSKFAKGGSPRLPSPQSSFRMQQISQSNFKSPYRSPSNQMSDIKPKCNSFVDQGQVKLYSSKYKRILNEEQGAYYSQLQAKLDGLAELIGNQVDHHQHIAQINDIINLSKVMNNSSNAQQQMDDLYQQRRALQTDLQNITYKISRFSDVTDI